MLLLIEQPQILIPLMSKIINRYTISDIQVTQRISLQDREQLQIVVESSTSSFPESTCNTLVSINGNKFNRLASTGTSIQTRPN